MHACKIIFDWVRTRCVVKIVITGLGAVTPVGIGAENAFQAMCQGKSGIRKLPSWADEYPAQVLWITQWIANILCYLLSFAVFSSRESLISMRKPMDLRENQLTETADILILHSYPLMKR